MHFLIQKNTLIATGIILCALGLFYWNPMHLHPWEPAEKALNDFDYTDLVFANRDCSKAMMDTDVVIINIGGAGRKSIDSLLECVSRLHPRAIGMDITFPEKKDSATDKHLARTIAHIPNLVTATLYTGAKAKPATIFLRDAHHTGYINLDTKPNNVVRYFSPFLQNSTGCDTSFAAAILCLYSPEKFGYLSAHYLNAGKLAVNYLKDTSRYQKYDYEAFIKNDRTTPDISGRIVLIGYYNSDPDNIEDKHVTPVNKVLFGKTIPDMNGIIINANILSMMLSEQYIDASPGWLDVLIAVLMVWLFLGTIMSHLINDHLWVHVLVRFIEIAIITVLALVVLALFAWCRWTVNLGITMWCIPLSTELYYAVEAVTKGIERRRGRKRLGAILIKKENGKKQVVAEEMKQ